MFASLIALVMAAVSQPAPACEAPSDRWAVIASSRVATIYERDQYHYLRGCQRGHVRITLATTSDRNLTVTRGRWVAYPVASISDEGSCATGCYDVLLAELRRHGRFRWFSLPHDGLNTASVRNLALGRRGVVLFTFRRRLILFGRTRTRTLARGASGTFTDLGVRGRTATWKQGGRRKSFRFQIEPRQLEND